jgi:hypothetical protein
MLHLYMLNIYEQENLKLNKNYVLQKNSREPMIKKVGLQLRVVNSYAREIKCM